MLRFEAPPALQAPAGGMFIALGMAEDTAGFLWFATERGLARFDGLEARAYPSRPGGLPSDALYATAPAPGGRLWVTNLAGRLVAFDPLTERAEPRPLPAPAFGLATTSEGSLWVATEGAGLYRLPPGREPWRVPLPGRSPADSVHIHAVYAAADGGVWASTRRGELFRVEPGTGRARRVAVPGGPLLPSYFPRGLAADGAGRVWALTAGGLARYDPARGRFVVVLEARRWPALGVGGRRPFPARAVDEAHVWGVDAADRLWVGSSSRPDLAVVDLRTGQAAAYRPRPGEALGAPDSPTLGFFEDRAGGVWVSTFAGLRRVAPPRRVFRHVAIPAPERSARLALDRQGQLLVSVYCGTTYRLGPGPALTPHPAFGDGLALCAMDAHEDARGALWVATFGVDARRGLFRLGPGGAHYTRDGPGALPEDQLRVLHEDPSGRLWVGTERGLARYDPLADRFVRVRATGFDEETVWALADAGGGRLWVGTFQRGLFLLDPTTGRARHVSSDPADAATLPSNTVTAVVPSRAEPGAVWVGTYDGGLARLDVATGRAQRFGRAEGLPSLAVKAVVEDRRGWIWASTDAGLVRIDPTGSTPAVRVFTEADGLVSSDFALYGGAALRDGRLAFATSREVVVFDPDRAEGSRPDPPLALTAHRVYDAERPVAAVPRELRLAPEDDFFAVEFAALDFAAAARARYRYRLDGFDRDWVEAGPRRYAAYTNVPPGRYTLRVEADLGGGWGRRALTVPVVVEPSWWEARTTRLGLGLALLGAFGGGVRYVSLRRLRRRLAALEAERVTAAAVAEERARIAADVHDHLGATLTRIQFLSELARRPGHGERLDEIAAAARVATRELDAVVWAADPSHDAPDDFADYLCACAGELADAASLRVRFERPAAWPAGRLPSEVRHPAYAAVKEALANAAKHARAAEVRLRFLAGDDEVAVVVEDDGRGFDPAAVDPFANGLRTMRARAEAAGGRLDVATAPGHGTRVRLTLPLRPVPP